MKVRAACDQKTLIAPEESVCCMSELGSYLFESSMKVLHHRSNVRRHVKPLKTTTSFCELLVIVLVLGLTRRPLVFFLVLFEQIQDNAEGLYLATEAKKTTVRTARNKSSCGEFCTFVQKL